jgi:hypothetical protein
VRVDPDEHRLAFIRSTHARRIAARVDVLCIDTHRVHGIA